MLTIRTPLIINAVLCLTLGAGCLSLEQAGSETAQRKRWNPFAAPENGYLDQQIVEEEEQAPPDPKDPIALRLKYARWMESMRRTDEAQTQYRSILQDQPANIDAQIGLARSNLNSGQSQSAVVQFQKLMVEAPQRHEAYLGYGQCQMQQQRWSEAATTFQQGLQIAPHDKDLHYQLAVALARSGDLANAQNHFQSSVGAAAGHYNIALILKDRNQLAEAEGHLKLALQLDPHMKAAEKWMVEIGRIRSGQTAVSSLSEAPIDTQIQQISFEEYDINGTTTIQTGQSIVDAVNGQKSSPHGHSVASESPVP